MMESCGSCTILRALSAVQRDAETMFVAGTALHACLLVNIAKSSNWPRNLLVYSCHSQNICDCMKPNPTSVRLGTFS